MGLTGVEDLKDPLPEKDRLDMGRIISGMFSGQSVPTQMGVTVSMNRNEARVMSGMVLLSALCSFLNGTCNMLLKEEISLDDGTTVREVPYKYLQKEQVEYFLNIKIDFHCEYGLDKAAEDGITKFSWDGYGENPHMAQAPVI